MKNKTKILLAEDDVNLSTILKEFLEAREYSVVHVYNGKAGLDKFAEEKFDLCILDVMMPKLDGFSMAKEIRKKDNQTPIIFLTAKSMQSDKIEGLKLGADDYITKPFSTEELFLRITRILHRTALTADKKDEVKYRRFEIGKYNFDYNKRLLIKGKGEQKLTSKESELLNLLCIHKDNILERSTALKEIWGDDNYFNARSMDVYIVKLRNHLKEDSKVEIVNVHGTGFKLLIHG